MRLLNTKTLKFKEFYDADIPKYAILSHCWGSNEIPYQDFQSRRKRRGIGYRKIREFCRTAPEAARTYGLSIEWVWVDTCCIDKSSSSEVSEAINAMYSWYSQAALCCAYLSDVDCEPPRHEECKFEEFAESRWWTRGWTLQELLACDTVEFFNSRWQLLGTKLDFSARISARTGIDAQFLENSGYIRYASVASRMSWASRRQTSRLEDMAYCLMGIFGVNMPLLYGEGRKAFRRLQEEIIRTTPDESIFAWRPVDTRRDGGMLAESVRDFADCRNIRKGFPQQSLHWKQDKPYAMTNFGLQMRTRYLEIPASADYRLVGLHCCERGCDYPFFICLYNPLDKDGKRLGNAWSRRWNIEESLFQAFSPSSIWDLYRKGDLAFRCETVFLTL
ncbi:hypothetical protein H2200_006016 [Cladophialophora chaetospira]|uniref:Heterokaryon incompatibility domain-containing protein n=1 Tax=Cladophialophora chaetospira TaxID=386627 RepID=A0AA39CI58_9EURO|nr:hypothetical protein H2200_006016 [Cladophialophora chaetospira]